MLKRVKIALAVVAVALVGVIAWQVRPRESEPLYQGKRLSVLLNEGYRTQ